MAYWHWDATFPSPERERVIPGGGHETIRLHQPACEPLRPVRVRADGHMRAAEIAVALDDRRGWVRLPRQLPQARDVDLEGGAALDERAQDGLVQLGCRREVRRQDVREQVALDEVEVADG